MGVARDGVVAGVLRNEIQCDLQREGVVRNVGNATFWRLQVGNIG